MPASMASAAISSFRMRKASLKFCGRLARSRSALEPRIEIVAQAVAEQGEGKNRQADRSAREHDHPGRLAIEVGGIAGEHQAPRRRRFCYPEPQERERGYEQDRL